MTKAPCLKSVREKVKALKDTQSNRKSPNHQMLQSYIANMICQVDENKENSAINSNLATNTISSAADVLNENLSLEERVAKLEEKVERQQYQEVERQQYQLFADYIWSLEEPFYRKLSKNMARQNFIDQLGYERSDMLRALNISSFAQLDLRNEHHLRLLQAQPFHQEIIGFYRRSGASVRFYLNSVDIRLKRNEMFHSGLPRGKLLLERIANDRNNILDMGISDALMELLKLVEDQAISEMAT